MLDYREWLVRFAVFIAVLTVLAVLLAPLVVKPPSTPQTPPQLTPEQRLGAGGSGEVHQPPAKPRQSGQ